MQKCKYTKKSQLAGQKFRLRVIVIYNTAKNQSFKSLLMYAVILQYYFSCNVID